MRHPVGLYKVWFGNVINGIANAWRLITRALQVALFRTPWLYRSSVTENSGFVAFHHFILRYDADGGVVVYVYAPMILRYTDFCWTIKRKGIV